MSVHLIQFGRDGKKYMVPVRKQADYKIIRDSERNRVYAFRNRFIFAISTIAPIVCGTILTAMPDSDSKLGVLRVFFYICGCLL